MPYFRLPRVGTEEREIRRTVVCGECARRAEWGGYLYRCAAGHETPETPEPIEWRSR